MSFIPTTFAATEEISASTNFPDILLKVGLGIAILVGVFLLATTLSGMVKNMIRKRQGEERKAVTTLYGRIVFFAVFALGAMIGLTVIGVPLGWFSGGVGLGLAFAMKSFITNFFAGILLLTNTRFNIGDYVILKKNLSGKIISIGGRSTTLRAVDAGEINIPNIKLLNANVTCYARNPARRHQLELKVGYESDITEAAEIIKQVVKSHSDVEVSPSPSILIGKVVDNAITLRVRFWTKTTAKWWETKSEIMREMFIAIQNAGITIPYPIQTLRVDEKSSGLLANNPNFLGKLGKIEKNKKTPVFQPTPVEKVNTPTN